MVKYFAALTAALVIPAATAETTIYFEDGSVAYTDDPVYSSPDPLYAHKKLTDGVIKFTPATPLVRESEAADEPVVEDDPVVEDVPVEPLLCWPWAGVGAPAGYSTAACVVEEEPEEVCVPDGLTFGGSC